MDENGILEYRGGMRKYIHSVDGRHFTIGRLFHTCNRILRSEYGDQWKSKKPKRVWYKQHGTPLPDGLQVIQTQVHLDNMWLNAFGHRVDFVRVYVQDCDVERDENDEIVYTTPNSVPAIVGRFNANGYHEAAEEYQKYDNEIGEARIGMRELTGRRWYISDDPNPRAPIISPMSLRPRRGRVLSSVPNQFD